MCTSPLLNLEYFDFVLDAPAEYLHSSCLGVVKRLVELTFSVGIIRPRKTKRKLTCPSKFNVLIIAILSPCEFSRRVRALDFSVWKGQEFRNLALFFFPIVIECLEPSTAPEKKLWLYLAFILRACVLPKKEFQAVKLEDIEYCCVQYYKLYERLFGESNCTYNTHVVFSHILDIRRHGPLTETSAFGFESFYGEIRNAFTPGTVSPLKQIMEKIYLKRALSNHVCDPQITFKVKDTAMECNNLIYTYKHGEYKLYKIEEIHDDEFTCKIINTSEIKYSQTPTLKWQSVGHFKEENMSVETVKVKPENIAGKVIRVKNVLLTCPINVLDEK